MPCNEARRRGWLVILLSLVDPVLGALHVVRWRWALFYFLLGVVVVAAATIISLQEQLGQLNDLVVAAGGILWRIVGTIHIYAMFRRQRVIQLRWYARWWGLALYFIIAMLLAVFIRACIVQPFWSPSGNMLPTLQVGDNFFVSKQAYGLGPYSFPFGPHDWLSRAPNTLPAYGDVVVFAVPAQGSIPYVDRVVGLPGDSIQMIEGVLHINGNPVARQRIEDYVGTDLHGQTYNMARFRETMPNGVSFQTLDRAKDTAGDNTPIMHVGPNEIFVMGDNRDNSRDSRFPNNFGKVTVDHLIGRVSYVYWDGQKQILTWRAVE